MSQLEEIQRLQIADEHDNSGTMSPEQNNKDGTSSTEQNNKDGTSSTEQNSTTEESTPSEQTDKNSVGQLETNSSVDNSHSELVASGSNEEYKTERRKLKRKDLKLPKDFKSKLAFLLYNVFTEEVMYTHHT